MLRDRFRAFVARNASVIVFLASYTLTVVVGNLMYALPFGRASLELAGLPTDFFAFETLFSFGFWALLLCPYVVAPLAAMGARNYLAGTVRTVSDFIPEFRAWHYALLVGVCYLFVLLAFWRTGAADFIGTGTDFETSVKARFATRGALGLWPLIVLQSVIPFLALYSVVRALQSRDRSWMLFAVANILLTTTLLVWLNMKWPPLLFMAGIVLALFLFETRAPYTVTLAGILALGVAYFAITGTVLRFNITLAPSPVTQGAPQAGKEPAKPPASTSIVSTTANAASKSYVWLLPLHRMALSYPYYYEIFTKEGQLCGGVTNLLRHAKCHPTFLVYTRTYKSDPFEGKGTSPAGVHISGYAFGGWPLALVALVLASVVMGGFAALPLDRNATLGTLAVIGGLSGYHLSQIPGEGVILNEHGLAWVGVLVLGYAAIRFLAEQARGTSKRP